MEDLIDYVTPDCALDDLEELVDGFVDDVVDTGAEALDDLTDNANGDNAEGDAPVDEGDDAVEAPVEGVDTPVEEGAEGGDAQNGSGDVNANPE